MPLARAAMHNLGESVHVAAWPTVREQYAIASRHYAMEGRCFVLAAGLVQAKDDLFDGLERAGVLRREDVVLSRARTIPVAYVIVDHACGDARRTIVEHALACGIEPAGRYGQWEYSGMEDALVSGEAAAARVLERVERSRAAG